MRNYLLCIAVLIPVFAVSCKTPEYNRELPPGAVALRKIADPSLYPSFAEGFEERQAVIGAIDKSIEYLSKPSSRKYFPYLDISHDRALTSLRLLKETLTSSQSGGDFHRKVVERFDVYESVGWDGSGTVLFTGYCEPIYDGSLQSTPQFRYPLYKLPPDLIKDEEGRCLGRKAGEGKLAPYYTRREIEERELLKGLELVYLRDPLEVYIIHVQGSARIRLPDGREMRVGYAGKTEHPYTSIGNALVNDGKVSKQDLSLAAIKRYFKGHPEEVAKYTNLNASYVFFTERTGGPYGSLNAPLSPLHSIATDKSVFPRACAAYVVTSIPGRDRFSALMLDQDTGGAIRSAGRADLFFGSGAEMEERAGRTYAEGKIYYLFAKEGIKIPQ